MTAGLADMWDWLGGPTQGQALVGALTGLIALLLGALLNARLNRRRDDRLRREDRRAVALALRAELEGLHRTLIANAESLLKKEKEQFDVLVSDLAQFIRIMPEVVSKLGLLDETTIRAVADAYALVEQYCERLMQIGGRLTEDLSPDHRRLVALSSAKAPHLIRLNTITAEAIQKAIDKLDALLAVR